MGDCLSDSRPERGGRGGRAPGGQIPGRRRAAAGASTLLGAAPRIQGGDAVQHALRASPGRQAAAGLRCLAQHSGRTATALKLATFVRLAEATRNVLASVRSTEESNGQWNLGDMPDVKAPWKWTISSPPDLPTESRVRKHPFCLPLTKGGRFRQASRHGPGRRPKLTRNSSGSAARVVVLPWSCPWRGSRSAIPRAGVRSPEVLSGTNLVATRHPTPVLSRDVSFIMVEPYGISLLSGGLPDTTRHSRNVIATVGSVRRVSGGLPDSCRNG